MALDPDRLLALPPLETSQTFSRKDVILYALGVGAHELPFVFEEGLKTLPTIGLILANPGFFWKDPRYGVDWRRVLHGESSIVLHAPLPPEGEVRSVTTFGPVFDKGPEKGAICYQTRKVYDADGGQLATVRNASFLRGDGGFGGSSEGQPKPHPVPGRPPDDVQILPTADNQGLIYRLSGDLNPLHIDPAVALSGGFPKPILHGLCTFGIAGRSILGLLCNNEPERLQRLDIRFSSPVFPGETIRTEIWREQEGRAAFRSTVDERNVVVLDHGYAEFT